MASVAPSATAKKQELCSHKMGTEADSIVVSESGCVKGDKIDEDVSFHGKKGSKTVSFGPKLRYKVDYQRQCSAAEARLNHCIAFSDDPCAGTDLAPTSRTVLALNGPRKGQIISTVLYCDSEPEMAIPGIKDDVAKVTPARFRQLPILSSKIESQPHSFSLRNGFAHMYASSKNQNFNITLDDQSVRIRAIPTSYAWSYGDGNTRVLKEPGAPLAEHSFSEETPTSHVYKETGDFSVGLTTRFRGEYSTEGGPWTPIPGTANVPSEPMPMSVWRTKKLLVDQNCAENPDGPACDSPFLKDGADSK
ncbi:PKD domain-containing protein [Arthrobacter sp.]|uniref:PKD domain-containing protein n=1 Tax=Arthrobacter sp. TaxID=1667 RepID=UPI003A8ED0CF